MGTQQVSGLFCARTETEGKGAGYLFCSPEVPGTGGLRMLNNNPLYFWTMEVAAPAYKEY